MSSQNSNSYTSVGNSKIGLRQVVDQVPYYHQQPSVSSCTPKWWTRQT